MGHYFPYLAVVLLVIIAIRKTPQENVLAGSQVFFDSTSKKRL